MADWDDSIHDATGHTQRLSQASRPASQRASQPAKQKASQLAKQKASQPARRKDRTLAELPPVKRGRGRASPDTSTRPGRRGAQASPTASPTTRTGQHTSPWASPQTSPWARSLLGSRTRSTPVSPAARAGSPASPGTASSRPTFFEAERNRGGAASSPSTLWQSPVRRQAVPRRLHMPRSPRTPVVMRCTDVWRFPHVHPDDRFVTCVCERGCGFDGTSVDF
jgi:hypothetical protein